MLSGALVIGEVAVITILISIVLDLRDGASTVSERAAVTQAVGAAAGLIVSLVLVLVTVWYVVETRRMVAETSGARVDAKTPSLLLRVEAIGVADVAIGLVNAGPGSARDVSLTLEFFRQGTAQADSRPWGYQYMAPGDSFQFLATDAHNAVTTDFDRVIKQISFVRARGSVKATDGSLFPVDVSVDVAAWGQQVRQAYQRFDTPTDLRAARALERLAEGSTADEDPFGARRLTAMVRGSSRRQRLRRYLSDVFAGR